MAENISFTSRLGQPWPLHMRPKVAAEYLGTSKAFLDQARSNGSGPSFVRVSRTMVIYKRIDLDKWLDARRVNSTAEADRVRDAE